MDPQDQFASPFSYAGNNPVHFTDPDGEILPFIIAAAIGGALNLAVNAAQGNLSGGSVWEVLGRSAAAFGSGAAAGALALTGPAGWAAGGAILGGTNAALGGARGWDIVQAAGIGAVSGLIGGGIGRALAPGLGSIADGIGSPALGGFIAGGLGGGATGFGLGGISSVLSGGNFWDGAWQGGAIGFLTGGIAGGVAAGIQAHKMGFNAFTGNRSKDLSMIMFKPKGANTDPKPLLQKPLPSTDRVGVSSKVGGDMKISPEITPASFKSFSAFKRFFGAAGSGKAWHHIVEQNPTNIAKFGSKSIHTQNNLIKLPHGKGTIHAKISGFYSSKQPFTQGLTVRQWLNTQSYQQQYDFGINTLNKFGWTP